MADAQDKQNQDQQWVVAYYDLLGITTEMSEWKSPLGTCDKIAKFRRLLAEEMLGGINRNLNKRDQKWPELTQTRDCSFIVLGFVDTVVIASPLENQYGLPQPIALSLLLAGAIPLAADLLADGIIFRAGIDVGIARSIPRFSGYFSATALQDRPPQGRRVSEAEVAGPAYIAAYNLASQKGSPPGIYVGESAVKLLQEAAEGTGKFQKAWVTHAEPMFKLLMRLGSGYSEDSDGDKWALDFANIFGMPQINTDRPEHKATHEKFVSGYQWACSELAGNLPDEAREKLRWLRDYLKCRLPGLADT